VLLNPNRYPEAAARRLRPWLERLVAAVVGMAPGGEPVVRFTLGVRFAGDREVRRANRAYRLHDEATDVLSFPGNGGPGGRGEVHLGDILISVPAARRQAAALGHDAPCELEILLLHGLLHCLGYDHETDGGEMERLERRMRRQWVRAPGADGGDARD
jgi:probable rRNA maturation factor